MHHGASSRLFPGPCSNQLCICVRICRGRCACQRLSHLQHAHPQYAPALSPFTQLGIIA
jgi:hypothetical protein